MSTPSERRPARHILVDERHAGQRIDNFLARELAGLPRARIYRILRRGEVRVNRGRIRQHYRLRAGDEVRIPPLRLEPPAPAARPDRGRLALVASRIVHEDASLLVIDKPAGLAVHGGSGVSLGLIECLRALRPREAGLELVHRLDRDTSGLLLVAKRGSALRALHAALREGAVDKGYLALVRGRWTGGERLVEAPLRKGTVRAGERVVRVDAAGKPAATRFAPRDVSAVASLLEATPLTGRTHQIRVHAAALGHPVAGDAKYGDRDFDAGLRALGLARLFLHAARIGFVHPETGQAVAFEAPLPPELAAVLAALGLAAGRGRGA